ncbi:MAG TPA: DUF1036 domain-containing protein [Rhizomicrobium sp.]|jgi:uncharacterized membrane protein|nr:DUF1036 domain-containing protein [Rhizomicrobium sp.]
MLSKSRKYSLAIALGVAGLAAVSLASPAQAASVVTLRACNNTKDNVLVAASFIPIGGSDWRNKGWTRVSPHSCEDIFKTANHTFYARAEVKGNSDQYWGSDIKQCVEYPGPYDFFTASEDTSCPEGEPAEFTTFHADNRAVYVWNLNP